MFWLQSAGMIESYRQVMFCVESGFQDQDELLERTTKLGSAFVAYACLFLAFVFFVVFPALRENWPLGKVVMASIILSAAIYATFDATLIFMLGSSRMPIWLALLDVCWGIFLFSFVAVLTCSLARLLKTERRGVLREG